MFFKKSDDVETAQLTLGDYEKIWTKFCFLDETGSLSTREDAYFTVGLLKMSQPYFLQSALLYERSVARFYDEMKFNNLSKRNLTFAKRTLDVLFDTKSIAFSSYTISTKSEYYVKTFSSDPWRAYEQITLKLLDAALSPSDILILIADHVTTPKHVRFEVDTKKRFNASKKRLALAGVCRFDSRTNDLLQVTDLLIGAITYDLKLERGAVPGSVYKKEFVRHLKEKLGVSTFKNGFTNHNFHIFVDKTSNEKGLSS